MRKIVGFTLVFIFYFFGSTASALVTITQDPVSKASVFKAVDSSSGQQVILTEVDAKAIADKKSDESGSEKVFQGFNLGAGLMSGFDIGGKTRIKKASIVNGIVRVDEENSVNIGVIAEVHRLYAHGPEEGNQWGYGPFVGLILSGDDNVVDAAALGLMIGFRPKNDKQSLNIGIGGIVTPSAQVLGDGIKENKPLPTGETEIRYKNETKYGVVICVSFGF